MILFKSILVLSFCVFFILSSSSIASETKTIYIAVWRGCEEACQSFKSYFEPLSKKIKFVVRNAERDKAKLPGFVKEIKILQPDLVVTWGTSVSKSILGRWDEPESDAHITQIPAVFMIVADPVGAKISKNYNFTGRINVTGTLNRAPALAQLKTIKKYKPISKIGMVYNTNELNARLSVQAVKNAAKELGISVVTEQIAVESNGKPIIGDIVPAVTRIARQKPDFLYMGSSSFLTKYRKEFTGAALELNLPVAAGSEVPVRKGAALLGIASKYASIGKIAALQAEKILFKKIQAGTIPLLKLKRYSVLINIKSAHALKLYPPMGLLKIAEIIK